MTKPKFDIQPNPYYREYVDITVNGKVVLREIPLLDAEEIVRKAIEQLDEEPREKPGKKK